MSDSFRPWKNVGRWLIIGTGAVLLVTAALVVRPMQIVYHRSQFEHWRVILEKQLEMYRPGGPMAFHSPPNFAAGEQYFHHLRRLVELRELRFKEYRLRHITGQTAEFQHFAEAVGKQSRVRMVILNSGRPQPMIVEAWTEWSDAAAWDTFIAERDVPDYRERFMQEQDVRPAW